MPKTKRKKNRNKTNITPSETQQTLKNLRKINKHQQITYTHVGPTWAPKTSQNRTPKRIKNQHDIATKKTSKTEASMAPKCLPNAPPKRFKKRTKNKTKREPKKRAKKEPTWTKKPELAVNGKRRIQKLFVIWDVWYVYSNIFRNVKTFWSVYLFALFS